VKKTKYDGSCSTHERDAHEGSARNAAGGRVARPLIALAAFAAAAIACGADDYYDDYYYDPYNQAYAYYYPADMAYSDVYYTGYYGYPTAYYVSSEFDLSPKGKVASSWPGAAIRDIALGKSICPGQVAITSERTDSPCPIGGEDGADALPVSTSIVFDDCVLPDGGRIDGSIDIDVAHTFSDPACGSQTVIDVTYTSTSTDLAYTAPGGGQIVLPSLRRSGSYQRPLAGRASALDVSVQGAVEHYDEDGALLAQMAVTGTQTITPTPEDDGYRVDGTLTMRMTQDSLDERTLSVSGVGVTRTDTCCHPTGGTLEIAPSDGETDKWSFGPGCGDVSRNGAAFAVDECL
jgi:hypothetical protein